MSTHVSIDDAQRLAQALAPANAALRQSIVNLTVVAEHLANESRKMADCLERGVTP